MRRREDHVKRSHRTVTVTPQSTADHAACRSCRNPSTQSHPRGTSASTTTRPARPTPRTPCRTSCRQTRTPPGASPRRRPTPLDSSPSPATTPRPPAPTRASRGRPPAGPPSAASARHPPWSAGPAPVRPVRSSPGSPDTAAPPTSRRPCTGRDSARPSHPRTPAPRQRPYVRPCDAGGRAGSALEGAHRRTRQAWHPSTRQQPHTDALRPLQGASDGRSPARRGQHGCAPPVSGDSALRAPPRPVTAVRGKLEETPGTSARGFSHTRTL